MKSLTFFLFWLSALSLSAQKPELVLPAIHATPIRAICYSADSRFMATCAGNEIKLWEQKTGRLMRTIQTPLPVERLALSKDGSVLVCGTYCGSNPFLEDQGYKPDINTEVQIWDMVAGKKTRTLKAFGSPVCISAVALSNDGSLATAMFDGQLVLWDTRSGMEKWKTSAAGSIKFSVDGSHLLLNDAGTLSRVDALNGDKIRVLKDSCVVSSEHGDYVIVLTTGAKLKRWNTRTQIFENEVAVPLAGEKYVDLYPNDEGGTTCNFRFSSDGAHLGLLNKTESETDGENWQFRLFDVNTGKLLTERNGMEYDYGWGFLSTDLQYYFTSPLVDVADVRAGMSAYSLSTGKFSHSFGLKSLEITTDANMFSPPGFSVYNEGRVILVQRDTGFRPMPNLLFFPERGEAICGVEPGTEPLFVENETLVEDKRWRLACKDNISYQISDAQTGKLVATLLVADVSVGYTEGGFSPIPTVSRIWAVTTPSGLFDASPEMMENLHYVYGMEVIELSQLKERYYEPGLLPKLMGYSTGELRNVSTFNDVALYPEIQAVIEKNLLKINLTERNGGIGKLSLFVNGKQMRADINPARQNSLTINLDEYVAQYRADVPNVIGLVAYNAGDWLRSQPLNLNYQTVRSRGDEGSGPKPSECGAVKPSLYLLIIGTSKYNDASKNLTYPDLDASEMAKALSSTGKVLFGNNVQLKLLSTAGEGVELSSKVNIEKAFQDFAQKATPCDVLVVYFSGHGSTWGKEGDKTNFYYLTKDITSAKLADEQIRKAYAVSDEEFTHWLTKIPAQKQVLILDACNSGKAAETLSGIGTRDLNSSQVIALELMKDRTGTFILTGSAADMVSFEASQYGQGLLTYSLLEGISGTALKDGKYVDIMTLFQNSRDVVPKLAASIKQVQIPVIAAPKGGASFPIGIKDASVKINLPQPKPIVIRSNFQDRDQFNDGLGLSQVLNDYFHEQTVKGVQARYVYYDISKYSDGYSIRGNYTISGEQVNVAGRLFKGDTPVGEPFQVAGAKDAATLRQLILEKVRPLIK